MTSERANIWRETGVATCVHHGTHEEWSITRVKHPRGDYDAFKCKRCNRKASTEHYHRVRSGSEEGRLRAIFGNKLRGAKRRANQRGLPCTITVEWLMNKYAEQGGKCVYTGWDFELTSTGSGVSGTYPAAISLERIDPSLGYTEDNVVLVCHVVNIMKKDLSYPMFISICHAVCREAAKV